MFEVNIGRRLAVLAALVCPLVLADDAANKVGALKVTASPLTITNYPGYKSDTWIKAQLGLSIENTGTVPLRLSLLRPISVQVDEGASFDLHTFSGLADCRNRAVDNCERMAEEFEVVAPQQKISVNAVFQTNLGERPLGQVVSSRLSGTLFVRNQETGKAWPANISVENIPVTVRLK
jgi:hypothetical protein